MADITSIANLALGRLGVGQVIASLSENSNPAKILARTYEQCRQEVLRAFPWGFATKAEALAEEADQTFPGWGYVYGYPSGCLRVRAVGDEGGIRSVYTRSFADCDTPVLYQRRQPYQLAIRDDGAGQVILSDVPEAWVYYTRDITNAGVWPSDFTSVLAWRWAMEAGGPLQARVDLVSAAETRYGIWFSQAAAASMNEQKDDMPAEPDSISCRR